MSKVFHSGRIPTRDYVYQIISDLGGTDVPGVVTEAAQRDLGLLLVTRTTEDVNMLVEEGYLTKMPSIVNGRRLERYNTTDKPYPTPMPKDE